ncbi:ubiquinol-cytochrome C chaperone family protein [Oceanibaculum pacificum]|uniref:Ubiquinol-cytochrome c chaperone domain-containing protein n=1 Tax=Oceanibaculum pacificum TaxID=580166 RepID=A0A154W8P9_9PROT|nr:ubiquinol-cytochrome C chaperone family protein [Oceanibaculum pacificum]KZD09833.1 hypothetical protein AUP43_01245 [Oceanibaculum pacificum]
MLERLFGRRPAAPDPVYSLYGELVDLARQPEPYLALGVPDTLDGRFEMVSLYVYLTLRRLRSEGKSAAPFSQGLFDAMFADMDQSLRELGAGDLGVGPRVKKMAEAFFGRVSAYDRGLAADDAALSEALRRNLYGTVEPTDGQLAAMVAKMRALETAFAAEPTEGLLAGHLSPALAARKEPS